MRGPVTELRAFVNAALIEKVDRDHRDPDDVFRRRQVVVALTFVVGTAVLAWALRITPGDPLIYFATLALAAVWLVGALLSGPLHAGMGHTRRGEKARPIVQSLVLGVLLLVLFLVGALVVARIPVLREPVDQLLDHARFGAFTAVLAITFVNGVVEELYFRGALYAGVGRHHAVLVTTVVYALVVATSGIPLLVLAAAVVGLVVGLQRRVTGGILGPIITHLIWSLGMLFLLPAALARFS